LRKHLTYTSINRGSKVDFECHDEVKERGDIAGRVSMQSELKLKVFIGSEWLWATMLDI
jgi:hypothetical protein